MFRNVLVSTIILIWSTTGFSDSPFPFDAPKQDSDINPADVILWDVVGAEVLAEGQTELMFRLRTERDFTIYQDKVTFTPPAGYKVSSIDAPPTSKLMDPISNSEVDVYRGGDFTIKLDGPPSTVGQLLALKVKYVGCTQVICLFPYTESLNFEVLRVHSASDESTIQVQNEEFVDEEITFRESWAKQLKSGKLSFGVLVLMLFIGGLASNLTPCVYPMIPITLRVLGNQGKSPYLSSSMYALGILVTYTTLGVAAAATGGMFGALMASKSFNIVFAIIMILLGISMLGFGNFSKLQMLGSRIGTGKPSLKNTFLMGTGAGLVASPCTGPILAALLAYTAKNHTITESSLLLAIYSFGFALPYVFLGGAAAKASQVKVPHQIQVAVKLLFAAVMFGLGLYYLRIPLYHVTSAMKEMWPVIASVGVAVGLALSILWVLKPALQNNKVSMILPMVVLGTGIFGASQWATVTVGSAELKWHKTEAAAYKAAKASGKPVLVDMWADWCEACKKMDATTFKDPKVIDTLASGWTLLKLDLTESNDANDAIQEKYELQSLPTLVLVPPDGNLKNKKNIMGYVSAAALLNNMNQFKVE